MFKQLLPLFFLFLSAPSLSAQLTVAPNLSGMQFNLGNVLVYHETGLTDKLALRMEAGASLNFWAVNLGDIRDLEMAIQPFLLVEPRYYYNFAKRENKGKSTANNSGNYIGLKTIYHLPLNIVSTGDGRFRNQGQVAFIPRWGIRRDLGSGWDFELGLGAGLVFEGRDGSNGYRLQVDRDLDITWRFGFRF